MFAAGRLSLVTGRLSAKNISLKVNIAARSQSKPLFLNVSQRLNFSVTAHALLLFAALLIHFLNG
jgi:hypothetical protein